MYSYHGSQSGIKNWIVKPSILILFFLFQAFQAQAQGPGGINSNIRIWLRGSDASASNWIDASTNGFDMNGKVGSPTIFTNGLNFNPTVNFNLGDYYTSTETAGSVMNDFPGGSTARSFFIVHRHNGTGTNTMLWYGTNGGTNPGWGIYVNGSGNYALSFGQNAGLPQFADWQSSLSAPTSKFTILEYTGSGSSASIKEDVNNTQSNGSVTMITGSAVSSGSGLANLTIGAEKGGLVSYDGEIAEIIAFADIKTGLDNDKITSYLALKYGITLAGGNKDYVASNGTIIWDASDATGYNNDIAGIGRDNNSTTGSDLLQLESKSQNTGAMVTMEASSIGTDRNFLTWSNNGGVNDAITTELPANVEERLRREWRVQEVGDVTISKLLIDVSGSGLSSGKTALDFTLLVDEDKNGNFADGTIRTYTAKSFSSNVVEFENVTLNDLEYFTLSTKGVKRLLFTQHPTPANGGVEFDPVIKVAIVDAADNVIMSESATIQLSLNTGSLQGTTSVATVDGEATFTGLKINEAGSSYVITASDQGGVYDDITSNTFNVSVGPAAQLAFVQQPSKVGVGEAIGPAITVEVQDLGGNLVINGLHVVGLSVNSGSGAISGTLFAASSSGLASFPNISISTLGTHSLSATSGILTSTASDDFEVISAPGAVGSNLKLWLKANEGVQTNASGITDWFDQSGENVTVTEQDISIPLTNDIFNFNPAVDLDPSGTRDYFITDLDIGADHYPETTIYAVYSPDIDNAGAVWGEDDGGWDKFLIDWNHANLQEAVSYGVASIPDAKNITSAFPTGEGVITSVVYDEDDNSFAYVNGYLERTFTTDLVPSSGSRTYGDFHIGNIGPDQTSFSFEGKIAEIIVVGGLPTGTKRQQVESYLAIKYGITIDQSTGQDYLASNGISVWDYSENTTFIHDIAGIGRDDNSGLNQPKSKSENSDAIMTLEANGGSLGTDGRFLIWGNNNGSATTTGAATINSMFHDVLNRVWRIQEKSKVENGGTGIGTAADIGLVDLVFDLSGIAPSNDDHVRLLIDDDGVFGAGTTIMSQSATSYANNIFTFHNIDVSDGAYIGVATDFDPGLVFVEQPMDTPIDAIIRRGTGVQVEVVDGNGDRLTGNTDNVGLAIGTNPGGMLSGTVSVDAINGLVTFGDISINTRHSGYTLEASLGSQSANSQSFNVTGAPGGVGTDLSLWLKADAGTNTTTDGDPLSSWMDQSGSGNSTMDPGGSGNVTFENAGSDQVNFNPTIRLSDVLNKIRTGVIDARDVILVSKVANGAPDFAGVFGRSGIDFGIRSQFGVESDTRWIGSGTGGTAPNSDDWVNSGGETRVNGLISDIHNGNVHISYHSAAALLTSQTFDIGGYQTTFPDRDFDGEIAEIIVYSDQLTASERLQIETYLAIKYGLTLDQTTTTDLVASNGIIVWDAAEDPDYVHNLATMASDLDSELDQLKSRSQNNGGIVTISDSQVLLNGFYQTVSSTHGSAENVVSVSLDGVEIEMLERTWRFQSKTSINSSGGIGEDFDRILRFDLSFDLENVIYIEEELRLVLDDDGVFGAGSSLYPFSGTLIGDSLVFDNVRNYIGAGGYFGLMVSSPRQLKFVSEPMNTAKDASINGVTGVRVQVENGLGLVDTNYTSDISLAISNDPSGGAVNFTGDMTVAPINGVATFKGLNMDIVNDGYTLIASSGTLEDKISEAFKIFPPPGGVGRELRYWWDASDLDGDLISEGVSGESGQTSGVVSKWVDKNFGEDIASAGPTNLSEGGSNFNDFYDVSFSQTQGILTNGATTAHTQFVVVKKNKMSSGIIFNSVYTINNSYRFLPSGLGNVIDPTLNSGESWIIATIGWDSSTGELNNYSNSFADISNPRNSSIPGGLSSFNVYLFKGSDADAFLRFGDLISYGQVLSDIERKQVESHLALKYGITLSNDDDRDSTPGESLGAFTEGDYLASNGSVIWDYSENTIYVSDVAGIGRDDDSSLNQKQSHSDNSDRLVTMGLDASGLKTSNLENGGSFSQDKSFLIWSNNNAELEAPKGSPAFTQIPDEVGIKSRLNRQWRVQETGSIGTVNVQFALSDLPSLDAEGNPSFGTNDEQEIKLLVSKTSDFTAAGAMLSIVDQSFDNGGVDDGLANFRYDFQDGDFFTLGTSELVALPIDLLSFEATVKPDHILLEWTTLSEENHDFFRIDRAGPELDFVPLGTVASNQTKELSNGVRYYSLKDDQPEEGPNYYRLVDVDLVGNEDYSKLVRVNYNTLKFDEGGQQMRMKVRPNPVGVGDAVILDLEMTDKGKFNLLLYDSQGIIVRTNEGILEDGSTAVTMSTKGLSSGMYVIRITSASGASVSEKMVVKY